MKGGRTILVGCKRWKAANHGLQPLQELESEREAAGAHEVLYVAASAMTDNAQRFAKANKIGLMQGPQLTRLLRLPRKR
jgi:restriction system protein